MLQGDIGRRTVCGFCLEQAENKVFGVLGHVAPVAIVEDDSAATAFFNQVGQVLGAERRVTAKESVGDNTQGPQVDGLTVALLEHDLRGGVTEGSSHAGEDLGGGFQHFGDTEVCQDEGRARFGGEVEKVFRFQV